MGYLRPGQDTPRPGIGYPPVDCVMKRCAAGGKPLSVSTGRLLGTSRFAFLEGVTNARQRSMTPQ